MVEDFLEENVNLCNSYLVIVTGMLCRLV